MKAEEAKVNQIESAKLFNFQGLLELVTFSIKVTMRRMSW